MRRSCCCDAVTLRPLCCCCSDTACAYGNEKAVGEAVRASGIPRSDIWITTKQWDINKSQEEVEALVQKSLDELGLEYVDLMLLHSYAHVLALCLLWCK